MKFRNPRCAVTRRAALWRANLHYLVQWWCRRHPHQHGTLEQADVVEIAAQFLYRQGETFVFMDNESYEQYELSAEQVDDGWKYLKETMVCSMVLFNNNPITMTPPNHVVLRVEYCEPGAKGNTATNVTKPCRVETGAEIQCPAFINMEELIKVDTRTGEYVERVKE